GSGWRHAFVAGLALAPAAAFVPLVWLVAGVLMLAGIAAAAVLAPLPRAAVVRRVAAAGAVLATSFAVLLPWSWRLVAVPRLLLAGLTPQAPADPLRGIDAMLLRPGGPAMAHRAFGVILLLAALPALLRSHRERRLAGMGAWSVAMAAMALAVIGTRAGAAAAWPGPALLIAGGALISAAMIGATGGQVLLGRASFGWRQPTALLIAVCALVAPLVALGSWAARGAGRPLDRRVVVTLPRYIVAQGERQPGLRVLWLRPGATSADLRYSLTPLRGAFTGADQLPAPESLRRRLDELVTAVASATGSDAAQALATHAVRYVALPSSGQPTAVDLALAGVLDAQPALTKERADAAAGMALWRVIAPTGHVTLLSGVAAREAATERGPSLDALRENPPQVLEPDERTGRYVVPPGLPGRLLVVSEYAGGRWRVRGPDVKAVRAWGWAAAAEVPAAGVTATVDAGRRSRRTGLGLQAFAVLVALVLAAPSVRRAEDDSARDEPIADDPPADAPIPVGASA
ncbi:MAG: hypothetical protein ABIM89_02200, partial [Mycobacteriales bacterium]